MCLEAVPVLAAIVGVGVVAVRVVATIHHVAAVGGVGGGGPRAGVLTGAVHRIRAGPLSAIHLSSENVALHSFPDPAFLLLDSDLDPDSDPDRKFFGFSKTSNLKWLSQTYAGSSFVHWEVSL